MTEGTVAIVGSGIVGTIIAYMLTSKGYDVDIFEKGPEYPYPHAKQFGEKITHLYDAPTNRPGSGVQGLTVSGDYRYDLNNDERALVVGGSATRWEAIALRMGPNDFKTRTLYGYGDDWPMTYDDVEPYYGKAEVLLGVSGTDADNPFAPWRSQDYPLPPFALSYDDAILAARLRQQGIVMHTTPQARTREAYEERPACLNFGACHVCPIGARYSPNYHLLRAVQTGRCRVHSNVSVRRIVMDASGRAKALVYQPNDSAAPTEHGAKVIIVAAGVFESARLLLLSADGSRGGLNNEHIGKGLVFHHVFNADLQYKDRLYPGRVGPWTGQSHQFLDPPTRGKHGGIKVECSSRTSAGRVTKWGTGAEIMKQLQPRLYSRHVKFQGESTPSPQKFVTLSTQRDRFGDPFAHVSYTSNEFDFNTYAFARSLMDRFRAATEADGHHLASYDQYGSNAHHMGGCCMGRDARSSVVNEFGRYHGSSNLFVLGGSNFLGSCGAMNPTLTMAALAIRAADYIVDQNL